ncbi:hypothetical protein [Amycolatopsis anabasis]|uniref:hypothetical protein n=1 Tax=Amycolatopsis anabasis TaxID=1840409 RepID=UPI00131B8490|nr:hypothetical protein [Amycolatopsis anabasis]
MTDPTAHVQNPSAAHEIAVPSAVRALSKHHRIDYENALFREFEAAAERTGEQWARAILEDAPVGTRNTLISGWTALGLPLGPLQSDQHVLGWPILSNTPDVVLLGLSSTDGLHAELLVQRQQRAVLFASFMQLDTDHARSRWAKVEPVHTPAMCRFLEEAINRVTSV